MNKTRTSQTWRTVANATKYEVHPCGLIRHRKSHHILRPWTHRSGHIYVKLVLSSGRKQSFQVHRLVLLAFRGEPKAGEEARHLDGDPSHNCLANLAWGNRRDNIQDMAVNEGRTARGRTTFAIAEEIRAKFTGKHGEMTSLANEYDLSISMVSNILRNKTYRRDFYVRAGV